LIITKNLLNIKNWEYNGKAWTTKGDKGIGVIAQEAKNIFPECFGVKRAKLNKNDKEETDVLTVNYNNFVGILLKATQELISENKKLKKRVSKLERGKH
jgi:hypothetical protein